MPEMATVIATFDGGRTLKFTDGDVSGDALMQLELQHAPAGRGMTRPDGPTYSTADWRTDPRSFAAACVSLGATSIKTADLPRAPEFAIPEGAV
jgi:hypothetical protein